MRRFEEERIRFRPSHGQNPVALHNCGQIMAGGHLVIYSLEQAGGVSC